MGALQERSNRASFAQGVNARCPGASCSRCGSGEVCDRCQCVQLRDGKPASGRALKPGDAR